LERLETVAIIGVGLIGGSVGLALRGRGLAQHVVGIGRDADRLSRALELGAIDRATTDLERGIAAAEVAVVCTPVTEIAAQACRAAEGGPDDLLVTDAGSTKRRIVEAVERHARGASAFVGGHPIAGSERAGVAHARGDLFEGRTCVLTPTRRTPADRLRRARSFWSGLGCRIIELDPAAHDEALALTSHLPHAVAAALAASVPAEALPMAAGAYRDTTRVAAAAADLWTGIFRENRAPVLSAIARFEDRLATLRRALEDQDDLAIRLWWDAARDRRAVFDAQNRTPDHDD
jgi:prephenate dehydrogenase